MANTMLPSGISVRIREDLIDGVSRTQTTLIIDPMITKGGHRVTMADIGSIGYGKISQGKSSEELISWTGITDNTTTYTLTGCTWGINFHNLSSDTANVKRHVSGDKFAIMTDMHYVADQFRDNADNVFTNTDPMEFQGNEILLGDGTNANDKIIKADNGDANEPYMKYDETLGKWVISNDGVNSYDPEDGGSGVTAGDGINIIGGEVSVDVDEIVDDEMLEVTGNRLSTVINEDTGLYKDANGLNIDVIDPDNQVAQSAGYLTGGIGHSSLAVFQSLSAGANNGAFKINVNATEYDNIAVDLTLAETSDTLVSSYAGTTNGAESNFYLTYTPASKSVLSQIKVTYNSSSGSRDFKIRVRENNSSGNILAESETISFGSSGIVEYTLNFIGTNAIILQASSVYYFESVLVSGTGSTGFLRYNFPAITFTHKLYAKVYTTVSSFDEVATAVQTAIRTATSSLETVVYDTDHFVITSGYAGRQSQVLKLLPPTTGTDISGAGYLDLGANATEVAGDGDDYKIVRLDEDGLLTDEIIPYKKYFLHTFTKNPDDASALQTIPHGLGKLPELVELVGKGAYYVSSYDDFALSTNVIYDGTTQIATSRYKPNGSSKLMVADNTFRIGWCGTSGVTWYTTGVVTFDETNIYINWTKTGTTLYATYSFILKAF